MSNTLNVYVKYFERVMTYFNGEDQPGRRCTLILYISLYFFIFYFLNSLIEFYYYCAGVCLEDFAFIGVHIGLGPPLLSQIIMVTTNMIIDNGM